ncbi:MAG: hypothetical protein ACRDA8_06290 [Shewanella sp.]
MKRPLLAMTICIGALTGCGSDDKHAEEVTPTPPPVASTVHIDEAAAVELGITQFDPATGTLRFALSDSQKTAITGAKNYDIYYFGFPDPAKPSANPKAWKRWHVTQTYRCHSQQECSGKLIEVKGGEYQFEIAGLDWQGAQPSSAASVSPSSAAAVANIKVAIQIYGAKAHNKLELIALAPQ